MVLNSLHPKIIFQPCRPGFLLIANGGFGCTCGEIFGVYVILELTRLITELHKKMISFSAGCSFYVHMHWESSARVKLGVLQEVIVTEVVGVADVFHWPGAGDLDSLSVSFRVHAVAAWAKP